MSCREISPEVLRNARSLEDVYTALGVMRSSGDAPVAPPRTFLPEGAAMSAFPYLTGTDGRSFNLGPLFANDREQYTCALSTLGYSETRGRELYEETAELDEEAFQTFVNDLSASDALSFNIYRTLLVMEFMRTDPPGGNTSAGGNTDNNRDVISAEEIENWAWERTGHDEDLYRQFGGDAVGRMHALLGIAAFLATDPVSTRPETSIVAGTHFDVVAPEGGWRNGDRVTVDGNAIDGVPTGGSDGFRVLASALPVGSHSVEIRRADGGIVRTSVTVTEAPVEESNWIDNLWNGLGDHWGLVAGVTALIGLGVGVLIGRNRGSSPAGNNSGPSGSSGRGRATERGEAPARTVAAPSGGVSVTINNTGDQRTETRTESRGSVPPPPVGGSSSYAELLEGVPGEGVLTALDGDESVGTSGNPFGEVMTYTVNDTAIEASLRAIDPALADFYRANISNEASTVTTMSDVIARVSIANPSALSQAQSALADEGRPMAEMGERAVFELIARAADWSPADVASRPEAVTRFEAALRGSRGVEARDGAEARAERERREREARDRTEARSPAR